MIVPIESEQPVEQVGQTTKRIAVKESGHCTQQVAEEVAGVRYSGDVELNLIELHSQPEDVQIKWAEVKIEDVAR